MSTGMLTQPATLDDIEIQLKDFTNRVSHIFDEPTDAERHAAHLKDVNDWDRQVMGNLFLAGVIVVIAAIAGLGLRHLWRLL